MSNQLQFKAKRFNPINRVEAYRFTSEAHTGQKMAELKHEITLLERTLRQQAAKIEELTAAATTDSLTNLLNRRGFMAGLQAALSDHTRYGYKGALIGIDLNHFKQVNDTLGHAAGDALLVHLSRLLARHTRTSDLRARLGGDEFAIVLKEVDAATANAKARALITLFESNPCVYKGIKIPVSASLGVATFTEAPETTQLLGLADTRMYAAKQQAHATAVAKLKA